MRLETRNLSVGYGRNAIGSGLDLSLEPGQIKCLLGPNGCGKTTLFKTVLGFLPKLAGEIYLGADELSALTRTEIARRIAYVPQAHMPPFPYDVIEVVLMGRTAGLGIFEQPGTRDLDAAYRALDVLGMADFAQRDYSRLSGGERQLVLIARALAQEAPVLVLDEPTASLDFGNQVRVLNQIVALSRGSGAHPRSILMSTHHPEHVFRLQADVTLMKSGKIVRSGSALEVLTSETLSGVYDIPVGVERTESGNVVALPGKDNG